MGLFKANDKTNNINEHNVVKNPNWWEEDQLVVYKHDRRDNRRETTPAEWSEQNLNPRPPDFPAP